MKALSSLGGTAPLAGYHRGGGDARRNVGHHALRCDCPSGLGSKVSPVSTARVQGPIRAVNKSCLDQMAFRSGLDATYTVHIGNFGCMGRVMLVGTNSYATAHLTWLRESKLGS